MLKEEIFQYAKEKYDTTPEYLWSSYPEYAVLRHQKTKKWYAVIMKVEKKKLGLDMDGDITVMNVKGDPEMIGLLMQTKGFLPGYHMNKKYWMTMLLDGTLSQEKILDFLDLSYQLIDKRKKDK